MCNLKQYSGQIKPEPEAESLTANSQRAARVGNTGPIDLIETYSGGSSPIHSHKGEALPAPITSQSLAQPETRTAPLARGAGENYLSLSLNEADRVGGRGYASPDLPLGDHGPAMI